MFADQVVKAAIANGKAFIMLSGIPGSGKSQFAMSTKERLANFNITIIRRENYRLALTGDAKDLSREKEVSTAVYNDVENLLTDGSNVILDGLNLHSQFRENVVHVAKKYARTVGCVIFDYDFIDCVMRTREKNPDLEYRVMEKLFLRSKQQPPTMKEGFDYIIRME